MVREPLAVKIGQQLPNDMPLELFWWGSDFPHSVGTFPHSRKVAHGLFAAAGMNADECRAVLRGNAVAAYGLERFGIKA